MEEQKKLDLSGIGKKEEEAVTQPEAGKKKISLLELLLETLKERQDNKRQSLVESMA